MVIVHDIRDDFFQGELQRRNKLMLSERSFKILQNETEIIKIHQAALEIFNFKDRDLDSSPRKMTEKPKMLFNLLRGFAKTEEQSIVCHQKL